MLEHRDHVIVHGGGSGCCRIVPTSTARLLLLLWDLMPVLLDGRRMLEVVVIFTVMMEAGTNKPLLLRCRVAGGGRSDPLANHTRLLVQVIMLVVVDRRSGTT